jgi:hypothetical protein
VAAVAITAIALAALDEWELWWLVPLVVLALSLALGGYVAPARRRGPWIRLDAPRTGRGLHRQEDPLIAGVSPPNEARVGSIRAAAC